MTDKQFWGKPCKYGHGKEEGTNLRNTYSRNCVACANEHQRKFRLENPQYLKDYYQKLRKERPEVLKEYMQTQIERGHRGGNRKNKPNKENPTNDTN